MPCGSSRAAWVLAPCTSTAAPSRLRLRSNSSVICVEPSEFTEVIDSRPAIIENWFSSGVATDAPIVSGPAPGRLAVTSSVGKSTFGRSLTGSERYATVPNNAIAAISKLVAMGRLMKPSEIFIEWLGPERAGLSLGVLVVRASRAASGAAVSSAAPSAPAGGLAVGVADLNPRALFETQLPFDDEGFPRLESFFDPHVVAHVRARGDRPLLDRRAAVARLHDEHERAVLSRLHGLLRHDGRVRNRRQAQGDAGELSGPQPA